MLTGNLGDKLIPQNEILRDVSDLKTLANLQESMEWLSSRLKGFFINLPHAASEYTRTHAEAGRHTHTPYGFHSCRAGGVCVGRGAGVRCVCGLKDCLFNTCPTQPMNEQYTTQAEVPYC